jgi:pimeloyl-ACP methyl ester carboxylesterase
MTSPRLAAWREGGTHIEVPCSTGGTATHRVWTRVDGDGPWLTAIHGFPTSSYDLSAVVALASTRRRVLCLDMIGLGESDRPGDHVYSIAEQADAVVAAWRRHGVHSTEMLGHDLGASVAQELLWRQLAGRLGDTHVESLVLANGGIYPDLHRPLPFQTALADPETGAQVSASLSEEGMAALIALTFGPTHQPSADEAHALWETISRHDGHRNLHLLIRYMAERREREADWVGAIEAKSVPTGFVWGMLDPISGAHIAERIVERFPEAPRRLLDDVGHWPPIEAPQAVAEVLAEVSASPQARPAPAPPR